MELSEDQKNEIASKLVELFRDLNQEEIDEVVITARIISNMPIPNITIIFVPMDFANEYFPDPADDTGLLADFLEIPCKEIAKENSQKIEEPHPTSHHFKNSTNRVNRSLIRGFSLWTKKRNMFPGRQQR